ncbi:MAG TPA: SAM-dependent chlorinase/fluorinase, partial [Flavobacteriales bacterium]|nr:SAM-dependent chlorinase/fluorinase [Flavobacteriales bacterium]
MSIITLTTDLGIKDHYVAIIKGEVYKQFPDINIVDISHEITKFDIQEAAFVFKNSYKHFPEGTVHIIGINDELSNENHHLAISINNQFIIGPDNGVFSLVFDEIYPDKIIQLNIELESDNLTFAIKDVFLKAACHLIRGGTLEMLGTQIPDFQNKATSLKAVTTKNSIRGTIIHIDSYGNATTNINQETFNRISLGRDCEILYGKETERIIKIRKKYKDVDEGERLALFSTDGFLEIAMNQGKANELLGLYMYD